MPHGNSGRMETIRNIEKRIFSVYSKEEDWKHTLKCEGTEGWRDEVLDKRVRNINSEISIMRILGCMK
jgi:hypothetical protein